MIATLATTTGRQTINGASAASTWPLAKEQTAQKPEWEFAPWCSAWWTAAPDAKTPKAITNKPMITLKTGRATAGVNLYCRCMTTF